MPSVRDWLVAFVAAGVDVALFSQLSDDPDRYGWAGLGTPTAVIIGAGAVAVPLLAFRRRAPVAVCIILTAYSILCTVAIGSRPLVTLLVALYTAAAWSSRRRALQCLAATLAAHAVSTAYEATLSGPGPRPFAVIAVATVFVLLDLATWAAGRRSSAARQRAAYLEASRTVLAAEAVKAERQRIARELHDIVAHSISLIAIQAAGAARVIDRDPARATQSMESIGRLSQQAINELSRMLTLIEETGSEPAGAESVGAGEIPELLPGVRQLVAQVGDSGHEVALVVTGTPTELDPSVRLAAHRIAQESLTNAVKHGEPATPIELAVGWTPNQLSLRISNHVADAPPSATRQFSTGRGLYGLQERARLVGGQLDAGSDQDKFIVAATLPTTASEDHALGNPQGHVFS